MTGETLRRSIVARAARLQPDLARRLLDAFRLLKGTLTDRELAQAIASGMAEAMVERILDDAVLDRAFSRLRVTLDQGALEAGARFTKTLPLSLRPPAFNVLSPAIVEAVRRLDTRVIGGLKAQVRETFRQHVLQGIRAGESPLTIARGARSMLDLAPNQAAAVRNFRRMLQQGDREALTRELRDHRFDRTLERALGQGGAGLSRQQVDQMTAHYHRRMVAFNAETQSRTAALDANRLGNRLSWQGAIDQGTVEERDLVHVWITVGDSKVRPEHVEMHGEEAPFGQRFSNGDLVPGESDYNCRCSERVQPAFM